MPINSSNNSSNQTDQAIKQIKQTSRPSNKQIKQTNRSSNQTDQANKQIKQTSRSNKQADQAANKSPQEAFKYLALSKPSRQVEIKRTSGSHASVEYRINKIDKRQRFLLLPTTNRSACLSRLKEMPLQLLPKIAKISRLVLGANRRPGVRPGPAGGPSSSWVPQTDRRSET